MMDLRINIKGSAGTGAVCRAADSEGFGLGGPKLAQGALLHGQIGFYVNHSDPLESKASAWGESPIIMCSASTKYRCQPYAQTKRRSGASPVLSIILISA